MTGTKENLGFLVTDTARLMRQHFQRQLDVVPLTLAQSRTLIHVTRHPGIRQVALAEILEIQPMTLARSIDQLVEEGLVERRQDPTDRRAYLLYITDKAEPYISKIKLLGESVRDTALSGLSDKEIDILYHAMNVICENLKKATDVAASK